MKDLSATPRPGNAMQDIVWIVLLTAVAAVALILLIWIMQLARYLIRKGRSRAPDEGLPKEE